MIKSLFKDTVEFIGSIFEGAQHALIILGTIAILALIDIYYTIFGD